MIKKEHMIRENNQRKNFKGEDKKGIREEKGIEGRA